MKPGHIFLLFIVLAGFGCSPNYYTPAMVNAPLIDEKGSGELTGAIGQQEVNVAAAYGVGQNVAIKADGSWHQTVWDRDEGERFRVRRAEIGAGYFTPVGQDFVLEIYGVAGMGDVQTNVPYSMGDSLLSSKGVAADFSIFGIQPNFGYKSELWTAGFSARFIHLQYRNIDGSMFYKGIEQAEYLREHQSNFLIEPAFTFKIGMDQVKLQLQYVYSINISNPFFRQKNTGFTLGLNFSW